MVARASSRKRIEALEAFVRAWDEFIGLSQHMNTMNPADERFNLVRSRVEVAKAEVTAARRAVGAVPPGPLPRIATVPHG